MELDSGLIGAAVGAIAALASTWLGQLRQERLERQRWQREDATRFHELRRDLYARFLALASTAYKTAGQRAALRKNSEISAISGAYIDRFSTDIKTASNDLFDLVEQIGLVATEPVHNAATEIAGTLIAWQLHGHMPLEQDKTEALADHFINVQRKEFLAVARAELGVAGIVAQRP